MIWIMGLSVPSANLLMTLNREEWLMHQRVMLPFRGRNELTGTS